MRNKIIWPDETKVELLVWIEGKMNREKYRDILDVKACSRTSD